MSAFENSNDRKALQGIVPGRLLHPGRPQDGGSRICSDLLRELETAPSSELQQVQAGENDVAQTTGGRCMCTQVPSGPRREALAALPSDLQELEAAATLATVVQGEELQYFCRVRDLDSRRVRGRDLSGVMARHLDVDLRKGLPEAFRKRLLGVAGPSEAEENFQRQLSCPFRKDVHRVFLNIRARESANARSPPPPDIGDLLRDPELPASLRDWIASSC
ncbi:hypothetical protein CYMTET_15775 [Cymbomonas tetramitiformis]|uniref:Uncharacterized protein n=1 Tax=Cymbomonas tetramitiformis TaxID=36881 RepID=A0AAE0GDB3_9CHLO|nr:hypothetical protein CYMTET_15775 [Cymbomonas tetramitiformis]